jgi:hypothetical protein
VKLDVAKGLPGPGQRKLFLGGAIGVVERRLRRAALGDSPQILDGERRVQPTLGGIQSRRSELQQRRQVSGPGHAPLHRTHGLFARSGQCAPDVGPPLLNRAADVLQQQRFSRDQFLDVLTFDLQDCHLFERIRRS